MEQRMTVLALVAALVATGLTPANASHAGFAAPDPYFVDVAHEAGLGFTCEHWAKYLGLAPRWFHDVFFCPSPALGDFNGDGLVDVFFPNTRFSNATLNAELDPQDALYLNNGDGTFTDATRFAGFRDGGYSLAAASWDFDDDGDLDIYIANFAEIPNRFAYATVGLDSPSTLLYVNEGDGSFRRLAQQELDAMGLVTQRVCPPPPSNLPPVCVDDAQWGTALASADYDRDGDLDLFRGHYAQYDMRTGMPPALQITTPDKNLLYRNDGGVFAEVAEAAGASAMAGRTFAVTFTDLNNDLWPDVYVADDENPNELYLNKGDGTFEDWSVGSGTSDPRGSMCAEAADFSGDGWPDLYMTNYESEYNGYYVSDGAPPDGFHVTFTEQSRLGDLGKSFHILGWGCPALDYDNDGDLDLFVANGHMLPPGGENLFPGDPDDDNGYELPNFLFKNTLRDSGQHSFVDMRPRAGPGLKDRFVSSGAQVADFDLDGTLEIVVVENNNVPVKLYKNLAEGQGHWLGVELRGTLSNSHGIGAKVVAQAGSLVQTQWMKTGNALGSGSAAPLHFGLAGNSGLVTLTITWPSGLVQTESVSPDQLVRVVEGQGVKLDTLAPQVDVSVAGTLGDNGWWISPSITVSLTAMDRGMGQVSGLASLAYSLDGGPLQAYLGPFQVSGEGAHRLAMVASDLAGNRAWYPAEFKIDSVSPESEVQSPKEGKVYVQDRPVADHPEGETVIIAPVQTPNDEAKDLDTRAQGVVEELKHRYGLEETFKFVRDRTGVDARYLPLTAAGVLAGTMGSDGLTHVALQCRDATSGLSRAEFALDGDVQRVDRAGPFDWAVDLRGQPLGEHTLSVSVYDNAGLSTLHNIKVIVVPSTHDGVLNTIMLGPNLPGGN